MNYGFQQPPPYSQGPPPPGGFQPNAPPQPGFGAPPPPYSAPGGQVAYIRQASSGLCLDGTEYDVKLQQFNANSPAQKWILQNLGGNRYIIKNQFSGTVLDIEGGPDCGANLITYEEHGGVNQQWFINPDRTITSAAGDLAIDVCDGNIYPGNVLIAYDRHGGQNQQFNLQYV